MTSKHSNGNKVWISLGLGLLVLTAGVVMLRDRLQTEPRPVLGTVGSFGLTNQLGQFVSSEELRGHVWVADIIFTRCSGPCPLMTRNLASLQEQVAGLDKVRLITLTADPEHDSAEVLRTYGESFGADPERWHFLTGSKAELYRVALDGLKLAAEEIDPAQRENLNDLYIHSTRMVLVDGSGQVRGYFDGVDAESPVRLLAAIRQLQRED